MKDSLETRVIRKFRKRLEKGPPAEDLQVTLKIVGGLPPKRLDEEFRLTGPGRVYARRLDELHAIPTGEKDAGLDPTEAAALLREILEAADGLPPGPEDGFGPDSEIGILTVEAGGERAVFYFDPSEPEPGRLEELASLREEPGPAQPEEPARINEPARFPRYRARRPVPVQVAKRAREMARRVRAVSARLFLEPGEVSHE